MDLLARLVIVAAVLAAVALVGWWWNRREGDVRTTTGRFGRADLEQLGLPPDGDAVLGVLLGSPTCAPCHTVKRVLSELEAERSDLRWTYADAADHLEIARDHHVMRVPTLFLLDPDGRILARTSGVPAKQDLERIIDRRVAAPI